MAHSLATPRAYPRLPEPSSERGSPRVFTALLIAAVIGVLAIVAPFLSWLVLAAWLAGGMRGWLAALAPKLHGRSRAAALLTLGLFVVVVGPVVTVALSLGLEAVELGRQLFESSSGRAALTSLVSGGEGGADLLRAARRMDLSALAQMFEQHGSRVMDLGRTVFGVGAELALGLFVFFSAAYVLLVDGPRAWTWFLRHAPIEETVAERLRGAFHETGRGLLVGIGLTALTQATIATIAYLVLGVPRPLVLGMVTLFASLIPVVGTALVWVPVAIGLAITGRVVPALVLVAIGMLVVSSVDNVLRPVLTKFGHLDLHAFVVLLSMLGGLATLGPAGLFLGPLVARLALELVRIHGSRAVTSAT